MVDKTVLAAKYNLQLVAGTFFLATYSGKPTDQLLCYFSRCQRAPFPAPLPGVNDLPSCQPSSEVQIIELESRVWSRHAGVRHDAARPQAGQAGRVRRGAPEPRHRHQGVQEVT